MAEAANQVTFVSGASKFIKKLLPNSKLNFYIWIHLQNYLSDIYHGEILEW